MGTTDLAEQYWKRARPCSARCALTRFHGIPRDPGATPAPSARQRLRRIQEMSVGKEILFL